MRAPICMDVRASSSPVRSGERGIVEEDCPTKYRIQPRSIEIDLPEGSGVGPLRRPSCEPKQGLGRPSGRRAHGSFRRSRRVLRRVRSRRFSLRQRSRRCFDDRSPTTFGILSRCVKNPSRSLNAASAITFVVGSPHRGVDRHPTCMCHGIRIEGVNADVPVTVRKNRRSSRSALRIRLADRPVCRVALL